MQATEENTNRVSVLGALWWRHLLGAALFVGVLCLYVDTAAPGLIYGGGVESESAQLQRVANRLGIAHSTGYPLHTLIGYGAARLADLFDANPYSAITLTSAIAGAAAILLFYHALTLVSSTPAAFGASVLLALLDTFWHISTITETQALHALSMAGLWWALLLHLKYPHSFYPLGWMALWGGIGLANHRTIVFSMGAAGVVVLLRGTWRRWSGRQWALLIVLALLPLLSYGYLYLRAQDPHVVFSTRPTWFPAEMDSAQVTDIIRGSLQSGEGLEGNLRFPAEDERGERWTVVRDNLESTLSRGWIILGLLGLVLLAGRYWQLAPALLFFGGAWVLFLMSWRLDWKAFIYQHSLLMPVALGLGTLAGAWFSVGWRWGLLPAKTRRGHVLRLGLAILLALPLFFHAHEYYQDKRPARDLSAERRGTQLYDALQYLPENALFYTGGWTPDTFISLEYLDESGRQDVIPIGTMDAAAVAQRAHDLSQTIVFGPFLRGFFGLYSASLFFQERGLSFGGTDSPELFTLQPWDDPRLAEAAQAAMPIGERMTPEIDLLAVQIRPRAEDVLLRVFWQATGEVATPYSVFTHLRLYGNACDDSTLQSLISQDDSSGPVRNMHPTPQWQPGEVVRDSYFIPLPAAPPANGELAIVIGMTLYGEVQGTWCRAFDWPGGG